MAHESNTEKLVLPDENIASVRPTFKRKGLDIDQVLKQINSIQLEVLCIKLRAHLTKLVDTFDDELECDGSAENIFTELYHDILEIVNQDSVLARKLAIFIGVDPLHQEEDPINILILLRDLVEKIEQVTGNTPRKKIEEIRDLFGEFDTIVQGDRA